MQKPKFRLGQQVAVDFSATQHIGVIEAAQIVGDEWKYGIKLPGGKTTITYVTEYQIKYWLKDNEWHSAAHSQVRFV